AALGQERPACLRGKTQWIGRRSPRSRFQVSVCHTKTSQEMNTPEPLLVRTARWLTFGSAVGILLGIAVSQILLAVAFAALLASAEKLRLPRMWLPLPLFMSPPLLSLASSPHPPDR